MKPFLFAFSMFLWILSFGQTKKETTAWLDHYLNKSIVGFREQFVPGSGLQSIRTLPRQHQNIFFDSSFLVYCIRINSQDSKTYKDTLVKRQWDYIDLSKVKKIEIVYDTTEQYNKYLRLRFYFNEWEFFSYKGLSVTRYDVADFDNKKIVPTGYYTIYNMDLVVSDMTEENLIERITKAINHLCIVNGAKMLKEVF